MLGSWVDPEIEVEEHLGKTKHIFMNERGMVVATDSDQSDVEQSFLSETRKVVVPIHHAYFHLITEVLAVVVGEIRKADLDEEKIQIVLIANMVGQAGELNHISVVIDHIVQQIERAGHSVVVCSLGGGQTRTAINNFSLCRIGRTSLKPMRAIADFMSSGVEVDGSRVRTRKVYLTRKKTLSNSTYKLEDGDHENLTIEEIRAKYQYKTNNRVDDERALEEYFQSLGFEVICPEDIKSYEDQIRLMMETRKLVSLTSAGLTSMIYMRPNGVVVELATPLIMGNPGEFQDKSIHPHYFNLSHEFELNYLAIPHSRLAKEIIERIEKTPGLRQYLSA